MIYETEIEEKIRNSQSKKCLISVGRQALQHLLNYDEPVAYICSQFGWSYDVYMIDGYMICTGYKCMPIGLDVNYEIIKKYNDRAQHINYNSGLDYDTKKAQIKKLQNEFIKEVRHLNGLN